MRSLQPFLLIIALVVSVLTSCTTEKRIYRPGYHTDWLGHKQINNKSFSAQKTTKEELTNHTIVAEQNNNDAIHTDTPTELSASIDNNDVFSSTTTTQLPKIVPQSSVKQQKETTLAEKKTTAAKKKVFSGKNKTDGSWVGGLMLMILALALLGLGLIFYYNLGVFGIILLLVFGIGGGIFFIVGLVMLLANL